MYGGTKASLFLPKYVTDYIVHKEAVRQVFLDGFGNPLFDLKKVVFPIVPFYVGSYKFNKVKGAPNFVKELQIFHFIEMSFYQNDFQGKVEAHKVAHKVNFEYVDYEYKEEQVYINVYSMAALRKNLKRNPLGIKGSNSNNPKPNEKEEEATKRAKEEATRRIAEGARILLAEEKQWEKEEEASRTVKEEEKRRKEEAIKENIA